MKLYNILYRKVWNIPKDRKKVFKRGSHKHCSFCIWRGNKFHMQGELRTIIIAREPGSWKLFHKREKHNHKDAHNSLRTEAHAIREGDETSQHSYRKTGKVTMRRRDALQQCGWTYNAVDEYSVHGYTWTLDSTTSSVRSGITYIAASERRL